MKRALFALAITLAPSGVLAGASIVTASTADRCGAGHRGCAPQLVRDFMDLGYTLLPETSSATISQYAYACAERPDWRGDCLDDPAAVLARLGLTPED
ncbi:hypothetical protein CFBP4996_26510 (plasmid) [Agrobacterium leguminum]|uniref:hypothetical protein n=1 Tax=Agrobacterium leguminum TaxID=2792015 RepID=UPI0010C9DE9B|nr:hypothetical protein [Agrobacterium leguminum]WFS69547.1 hypothetical protein CFBP4996_26510 [Agrobacterium leguminum]